MKSLITLLGLCIVSPSLAQTFESGTQQVSLIELYSSQGCSSCPPAERWISRLKQHPQLWKSFVPVVFHVDYWNHLGWTDPFSSHEFSQRQRITYRNQGLRTIYTPGFLLNGREWRRWYSTHQPPLSLSETINLSARLDGNNLYVEYESRGDYRVYAALLLNSATSLVKRGENAGLEFTEDFIVIELLSSQLNNNISLLRLKKLQQFKGNSLALAVWVTENGKHIPLQTTGDWIKP